MKVPRHAIPTPGQYACFCLMAVVTAAFWPQKADATDQDTALALKQQVASKKTDTDLAQGTSNSDVYDSGIVVDAAHTKYDDKSSQMTQAERDNLTAMLELADSDQTYAQDYNTTGAVYREANPQHNGDWLKAQGDSCCSYNYWAQAIKYYRDGGWAFQIGADENALGKYNLAIDSFNTSSTYAASANCTAQGVIDYINAHYP